VVAAQSNTESLGLSEYFQLTFALGYLALTHMVSTLIRSVLVNTTNPSPASEPPSVDHWQPPLVTSPSGWFWKPSAPPPSAPGVDDPRRRFWYRRWSDLVTVLYFVAMGFAIAATSHIYRADQSVPNRIDQGLR
jgi:hypothetical protein